MSGTTDRTTRIASRIRGAGTRNVTTSSFAISMPRARTPKSGGKKKTPQTALRSRTLGPRRTASDKKINATAVGTTASESASDLRSSGQVTVFARTPQYAKRSTPLRRKIDHIDGKSNKSRQTPSRTPPQSSAKKAATPPTDIEHEEEEVSDEAQDEENNELEERQSSAEVSDEDRPSVAEEDADSNDDEIDLNPSAYDIDREAYTAHDSDEDPEYESHRPAATKPALSEKRKAKRLPPAPAVKKQKQSTIDAAEASKDDTQYVRIVTHKLPPRDGGRGAPTLSDVDVVSQVISEQVSLSASTQSSMFRRKILAAYAEELEIRFSEMCDAVNTHGVLARAARKARRNVDELRDKLLAIRKKRRDVADEVVSIRAAHLKGNLEAKAENSVKEVLDAVAGVKSRAANMPAVKAEESVIGDDASDSRIGVIAELQKTVPLVCGHGGILERLRAFNNMLEQKEKELSLS
ncbi:hypothetical protein POJ06DRAFT_87326 [Lipomyces tetrasporus]|uniref:Inner kinetochore subunit AME1 domain-containing protein n=1 Tax=Lipomyces tetrasporus TaxID=54092 RepID=A0AAD7VSI0_9ASCO|nr:uncharacterized protein POJ06DRAFT_87326 [Lipomyces tetrasporus]KAJ8101047.1 hypothetical protein POJ06DRAFT_87326 [Lipomyces tetrasporus]